MNAIQTISLIITIGGAMVSLMLGVILHRKLAVQAAAVFLMLVGTIVIIGYAAEDAKIYTLPPSGTGMALPTGICFFVVGGCLLVLANEIEFKK